MNRFDDRFWRGRRSEYESDDWRRREREGREASRESFQPGNHGFEEGEYSGRTAGGADQQPFSRNPYGYYPGQNRSSEDWRDRGGGSRERYGSERFGQREPYNTRGDYSQSRSFRSDYEGPGGENEGRYEDRYGENQGRYGRSPSRYSESQYSSSSREREPIGGYGPGGGGFGYEPGQREWPRRGRERSEWSDRGRYGTGPDTRYGEERGFGEGPFADTTEEPGYFGMGYYGDGGAAPTGGFDQRTRSRNYGSLAADTFSSDRDWQSSNRGQGRSSPGQQRFGGPKGYTRSDDRLREDICERLMVANSVDSSDVTVNVKDGQVTLEGSVPNRRMKHTIEDLVDAAPGVQDIDNRLRVERGEGRTGTSSSSTSSSAYGSGSSTTQRASGAGTSTGIGAGTGTSSGTGTGTAAGTGTSQSTAGAGAGGTGTSGQRRKE